MCFPEYAKHRQANYSMVYGEEFPALLRARVDETRRYFLIMPEPPGGWSFEGETDELLRLFTLLSDADFFKAVVFLHQRAELKFTAGYLGKTLGYDDAKTADIIEKLKTLELITEDIVEIDDASTVYHTTTTNSAIIPFLTFAEDMVKPAVFYSLGAQLGDRPWLQTK
jgi:hypothetical protein